MVAGPSPPAKTGTVPADGMTQLDPHRETIGGWLDEAGIPGGALALVDRSGHRQVACFGHASLTPERPVEARTRFHLFSGTKLYTAATLLRLVEEEALSLEDDVRAHLPERPLRHPVTLRQLASHQAGIPDTVRALAAVHEAGLDGPSAEQALDRFRLDHGGEPGTVRYTNVAYALLGAVIVRVTGQPFEEAVRQRILAPLGAEIDFTPDEGDAAGHLSRWDPMRVAFRVLFPRASGWLFGPRTGNLVALRPFGLDTAAIGGLIGPAEGFLPFLAEMLSGEDGVLTAASKRAMLTVQAEGAAGVASRGGVGLGWKWGPSFWNHEGGGPGFCSETRLYPGEGFGLVILLNRSQTKRTSLLCHRIAELLRRG
jgi:CubicO group peptidase (beta-lactamase class C family)